MILFDLFRSVCSPLFRYLPLLTPLLYPPTLPYPPTAATPPFLGFHCTNIPVQYTSSPAVLLFLHQYTVPGARGSTYSSLSLVVRLHCRIHPSPPVLRLSLSPDLIVEHFPGGS